MTLELCNEIIVLKAAAMLPDIDEEFAIIGSAHEAKSRHKYRGTGTGTKKVTRYFRLFNIRYCPPLYIN